MIRNSRVQFQASKCPDLIRNTKPKTMIAFLGKNLVAERKSLRCLFSMEGERDREEKDVMFVFPVDRIG